MANVLAFVGMGVSGVALLFAILAISSKYWETATVAGMDTNIGLWDFCLESSGTKICTDVLSVSGVSDETKRDLRAVRAMLFLGIFATLAAIISGILVLFVLKSNKMLYFVAGGLDIAAGLFLMTGMAIYVDKLQNDDTDLSSGFAFVVVAWITAWAAGGIFIGAKMMDKE